MTTLPPGCIQQRDKETYAIRTTPTAGMVTPEELETVARVARKYNVPVVKITTGQRFALIGLKEENVHQACEELPFKIAGHYVQACAGNQWCKFGVQDAQGMAVEIEKRYGAIPVLAKIKIGISGCPICCAESYVRDIGIIGSRKGWTVVVGGNSASKARIAEVLAENLSSQEVFDHIDRFLAYYNENGKKKQRISRFVAEKGIEAIQKALL